MGDDAARRYRRGRKVSPFCYAIWFPVPDVLKIGCTTIRSATVYVAAARQGARRRGWDTEGCSRCWHEPGDERTEAFIQASVSFEWPGACAGRQLRLSEWFRPGIPVEQIVARLAAVYRKVPPDRLMPDDALHLRPDLADDVG